MAETLARRGALAVLPQDVPVDVVAEVTAWVKGRDTVAETPITVAPDSRVTPRNRILGRTSGS